MFTSVWNTCGDIAHSGANTAPDAWNAFQSCVASGLLNACNACRLDYTVNSVSFESGRTLSVKIAYPLHVTFVVVCQRKLGCHTFFQQ